MDRLFAEHGLTGDTGEARQEFERRLEARRLEPGDQERLNAPAPAQGDDALGKANRRALAPRYAKERQFPSAPQADAKVLQPVVPIPSRLMNRRRKDRGLTPFTEVAERYLGALEAIEAPESQ